MKLYTILLFFLYPLFVYPRIYRNEEGQLIEELPYFNCNPEEDCDIYTDYYHLTPLEKYGKSNPIDSIYSWKYKSGSLRLTLYKESKYYEFRMQICIGNEKEKMIELKNRYISTGKYHETDSSIVLTDACNDVRIPMTRVDDYTFQVNDIGFTFLKGKQFHDDLLGEFRFTMPIKYITEYHPDILYQTSIIESVNEKPFSQKKGNTTFISNDEDLFLELTPNGSYHYYICGLLMSEGNWSINGNRLELNDRNLSHTFYGKRTSEGVLSGYWPGDQNGILLKRIEKETKNELFFNLLIALFAILGIAIVIGYFLSKWKSF